jgi:putative MATE family efflux protein
MLFGNLFQQLYNMADSMVVGKFVSKEALAAVGSVGSLSFMILGFVSGMCIGFCVPVSRFLGAKNDEMIRSCWFHIMGISLAVTLILTVLMHFITRPLLHLMKTPDNIIADADIYIRIIVYGLIATVFYNIQACVMRALGDSRTPLYFLIISAVLNVALDLVFVLMCGFGVSGTAYATIIAQGISGILCFFYMRRRFPVLRLTRADFRFDKHTARLLLGNSLPMAFQFSITAIGAIILQSAVNALGSDAVAAITASNKVSLIMLQPLETVGITMATYCSQNLGAQKPKRIFQGVLTGAKINLIYAVAAGLTLFFFGAHISALFIKGDEFPALLPNIKMFLRFNGLLCPLLATLFIFRNAIQGLGYGALATLAGVFELAARAGMAFAVAAFGFGAICFASPSAWAAALVFLVPAYLTVRAHVRREVPETGED